TLERTSPDRKFPCGAVDFAKCQSTTAMSVLSLRECPDVGSVSAYALSRSSKRRSRAKLAAGLLGSLALFPLVLVQGMVTRRRMPSLPAAQPTHRGFVPGAGRCLRIL